MASKRIFIVFVLPVIFSVAFGSAVMGDILQEPDRELNMIPSMSFSGGLSSHGTEIEIIGLSKSYSTSEPVEISIEINDATFDCGDLYVTIYSGKDVITQGGFFEQCFGERNELIPIGDKFSKVIDTPGSYKIVAEMISKDLKNISISGEFTVK
ncbi:MULTISPECIES: hypothetical protein [Nitrosopumilus]|uniref:Uncharacterized protein n=1 Tax=Nitrosopumilus piranensis TaxID=1582439 RepID=A0A0C5BU31_9ARCH|nr:MULTISPECIES: hypothetical protein [Nitrosopumilus]AJM93268.1 conserved exported protein of unknown function [Nitrosopumilus piranensis]KAF6245621.1 hypothetical protein C6989_00285 [Nitrosopumilus sp. b2]